MKKLLLILTALVLLVMAGCSMSDVDKKKIGGTVSNGVYKNSYAGITFTPAADWTFSTTEEINAIMSMGIEDMDAQEKAEYDIAMQKTVYDAMAASNDGSSVIIMFENLALTVGGTSYNEKEYADTLVSNLLGYTVDSTDNVTIGGNTYYALHTSVDVGGMIGKQDYILRRLDNYMVCICVTTFPGYTVSYEEILAMFS